MAIIGPESAAGQSAVGGLECRRGVSTRHPWRGQHQRHARARGLGHSWRGGGRRPRAQPRARGPAGRRVRRGGVRQPRRLSRSPDGRRRDWQPIRRARGAGQPRGRPRPAPHRREADRRHARTRGSPDRRRRAGRRARSACSSRTACSQTSSDCAMRSCRDGSAGRCVASARVKWYRPPEYYGQSHWRGTWALDGGGALMNQGIHTVDLLQWLLGPVRRLSATTRTRAAQDRSRGHGDRAPRVRERSRRHARSDDRRVPRLQAACRDQRHRGHARAGARSPRPCRPAPAGRRSGRRGRRRTATRAPRRRSSRTREDISACSKTSSMPSTSHRDPICTGQEARKSVALVCAIYEAAKSGSVGGTDRE